MFTCGHNPAYTAADPDTDGTSPRLVTPSGAKPRCAPPTLTCSAPPAAPAGPKDACQLSAPDRHHPGFPATALSRVTIGAQPADRDGL
jgi:hypothetical protein